ncbi:MAG: ComEC/Rec2 family competence protein [Planctomycetota bacterium]
MGRYPSLRLLLPYATGLVLGGPGFLLWVLLAALLPEGRQGLKPEDGAKRLIPILMAATGWLLEPLDESVGLAEGLVELRAVVLDGPWSLYRYGAMEDRFIVSGQELRPGIIQIRSQGFPEPPVSAGDHVRFQGWLRTRGKVSWIETRGELLENQGADPIHLFHRGIYNLRRTLWEGLSQSLNRQAASLDAAMLLGLPDMVDAPLRELFRKTGCAHLLAISGLHMAMIYLMLYSLLIRIGMREQQIFWPMLILLFGYSLITGCRIPVLRAFLVCAFHLYAARIHRQIDPFEVLFHVCLILLLIDPGALFEISFQLSFAGYSAILLFLRIQREVKDARLECKGRRPARPLRLHERWIGQALFFLGISTASWLGTMPLTWLYFECFIPWAPVINLAVFPFFMAALTVSSVHLFIVIFGLHFSLVTVWPVECCIEALTWMLGECRTIPPGALEMPSLPAWVVCWIYAVVFGFFFLLDRGSAAADDLPPQSRPGRPR